MNHFFKIIELKFCFTNENKRLRKIHISNPAPGTILYNAPGAKKNQLQNSNFKEYDRALPL